MRMLASSRLTSGTGSRVDHTEDGAVPDAIQFLLDRFPASVVFVTKDLTLASEGLTLFPKILRKFTALERLDLSRNFLSSLPAIVLAAHMPNLRVLDISQNRMASWEAIQALGALPKLVELSVDGNPKIAVSQRDQLLCKLFFPDARPSREHLLSLLGYTEAMNWEMKPLAPDASRRIISTYSTSQLLIRGLVPGNITKRIAQKALRRKGAPEREQPLYCDFTPAPVPRVGPFPNLTVLTRQGDYARGPRIRVGPCRVTLASDS